jgi:hypothetical protein
MGTRFISNVLGHRTESQTPVASRRASSRDGRAYIEIHVEIGVTLLQKTNDSSRVNLNRIFNQKTRTTYEPGVVVLTALQITSLP